MTVLASVQQLEPGVLWEGFELDASAIGGGIVRFHGYSAKGSVFWKGLEYSLWPIAVEGFARTSDQQPQPKLSVGNVDGSITSLCLTYEDLVGAKLTRRRTFGKFLDARNWDGSELVVNGTFPANTSSWVPQLGGTLSWQPSGVMRVTSSVADWGSGVQGFATIIGQVYRVRGNLTAVSASQQAYIIKSDSATVFNLNRVDITGMVTVPTTANATFTATATTTYLWLLAEFTVGAWSEWDNISCKLDGINPTADPTQEFPPETWFIERKASETNEAVDFELSSALDFQGIKLPRRQIIANQCPWVYRGAYCGYIGPAVATILDAPTTDPALDKCGKRYSSCKLRQWPDGILNYGGFLAAGLVRT